VSPAYARVYVAAWATASFVALILAARFGAQFAIASRSYGRALLCKWRLATFAPAFVGIVLVAPRTGDPTLDYWDAAFMALLTYLTAPWALGVVVRAVRRRAVARAEIYVAVCTWLFSASFSYDLYLLLRDGHYPATWWSNALASTALYTAGGAMWSLSDSGARRATFAFLRDDWPASLVVRPPRAILPWIAFFMFAVLAALSPFLWFALH
jgi:hypothetical protein